MGMKTYVCVQSWVGFMQLFTFKKMTNTLLEHISNAPFLSKCQTSPLTLCPPVFYVISPVRKLYQAMHIKLNNKVTARRKVAVASETLHDFIDML